MASPLCCLDIIPFILPYFSHWEKEKKASFLGLAGKGSALFLFYLNLPAVWGLNGILYAQPIADVLSAFITVFMAIPLHKNLYDAEVKMKETASPIHCVK